MFCLLPIWEDLRRHERQSICRSDFDLSEDGTKLVLNEAALATENAGD